MCDFVEFAYYIYDDVKSCAQDVMSRARNKDDWSGCPRDNQTDFSGCLQNGLFVRILGHI